MKKLDYAIVIHGGAGTMLKEDMTQEQEVEYRQKLDESLCAGEKILASGGAALEAVEKAIWVMEDSPLFNAGKGAVFTHEGLNELDACIMDGSTLMAGAVAGVRDVKNPISLAIKVMTNSEHVFLIAEGASKFAREQGLEIVDNKYFYTERRWDALQKAIQKEKEKGSGNDNRFGTVGCVVLDKKGNIAAGTSTGGMTNKKYGRVGDSPIIGGGTYANNKTCGISATGHGEFFIRYCVAYDIAALMEYKRYGLDKAANEVIYKKLENAGGKGGLVALDRFGNVAMPFNTTGMYRGYRKSNGEKYIGIFNNE